LPSAKTLTDLASPFPVQRSFFSASIYQHSIYVTGGEQNNPEILLDTVQMLKVNELLYTPIWNSCPPMRLTRRFHSASIYKDQLWVIGGQANQEYQFSVEIYDFKTNKWLWKPNFLFHKRAMHQSCVLNNILYVLGGSNYETFGYQGTKGADLTSCEKYIIESDCFRLIAPMKYPRHSFACIVLEKENKIIVAGGRNTKKHKDNLISFCEEYNPTTNVWKTFPSLPEPRINGCSFVCDNEIYIMGGDTLEIEAPTIKFNRSRNEWCRATDFPNLTGPLQLLVDA